MTDEAWRINTVEDLKALKAAEEALRYQKYISGIPGAAENHKYAQDRDKKEFSVNQSINKQIIEFFDSFVPIFEERLKDPKDAGLFGSMFGSKKATSLEEAKTKFGYSDGQNKVIDSLIALKNLRGKITITEEVLLSATELTPFKEDLRKLLKEGWQRSIMTRQNGSFHV